MEFRPYVVVLAILSIFPAIDVEKHWNVNVTPVAINKTAKCARVDVPAFSNLKRFSAVHFACVVLIPPPEIPEKAFKRIRICLHNNPSLGRCQCEKNEWGRIQNGMWGVSIDPYEHKYVDIMFVGNLTASVTLSIKEYQRWSVEYLSTYLVPLPLPSVVSGLWVSVLYSCSMATDMEN